MNGYPPQAVEMPQLGVTLEIPKQIALANIALRVQQVCRGRLGCTVVPAIP